MMLPLVALSVFSCIVQIAAQPTVKIGKTTVVGKQIPNSKVDFFGGLPFAKPPIGELRLNLPVFTPTLDVARFDASKFGPACLQIPIPPVGVSEDCLALSIFRPSGTPANAKLPVVVWIYGGSFTVGDSSFYDATSLITRSVTRGTPTIFVGMNYRVGPLGFPTGVEAGNANVLNLGLHDQLTGLQWLQENIEKFGGDKTKVTVMGESAGAACIQLHLQETKIVGLARAAIVESGGLISLFGPEKTQAKWNTFVSLIPGCASSVAQNKTIDCIRNSDTASLFQAHIADGIGGLGVTFGPIIDGPQGLIVGRFSQNPPQAHLPVLLGSNLDEGTLFVAQNTNSTAEIRNALAFATTPPLLTTDQINEGLDTLLALYPDVPALGSPFGTGNNTFGLSSQFKRDAAIMGDFTFTSGRRIMAQTRSATGDKMFAYLFTDPEGTLFPEFAGDVGAPGSLGIPHTSELAFVYGILTNVSAQALSLSTIMQDYWLSFINGLDPNDSHGAKRPVWEQYTPQNQAVMQLEGTTSKMIPDNFREEQIAFFANNHDLFHT